MEFHFQIPPSDRDWETKNLEITATLPSASISGGAGGSINKYNYFGTGSFESGVNKFYFDNSDYFRNFSIIETQGGLQNDSQSNVQREFYDGEYSGSTIKYRPKNYVNGSRYNPYRIDFETIQEFPLSQYVDFTSELCDTNNVSHGGVNAGTAGKGANNWTPEVKNPFLAGTAVLRRPGNYMNKFDYNRLIKFYESSLFKAIKNYVPSHDPSVLAWG